MNTLPIGALVERVRTWNPAREPDREFEYIDLSAVDNTSKAITGATPMHGTAAPSRARQLVAAGDVLVSTVRPNLNAVAVVPTALDGATASTGFTVLRPGAKVDGRYLFHWVRSPGFIGDMVRKSTGASYPAVSDRTVKDSSVPSPPLEEQRRIAAILDRADAIRAKRIQLLARVEDLTQDLYQDLLGKIDWPRAKLGSFTSKVGSGATPRGGRTAYKDDGVALIRSMNVHDGRFVWKDLAFLDEPQAHALSNVTVEADDVLLNITGASVARVCRAPESVLPARVNQHVAIVRPTAGTVHSQVLERYLLSPSAKRRLLDIAGGGATREAITKSQILELDVPVPSQDAQARYLRAASALDAIRKAALTNLAKDDELFASLQSRAFRGEL